MKQSVAEELYGIVAVVAIVKIHLNISLILFEIKKLNNKTDIYLNQT